MLALEISSFRLVDGEDVRYASNLRLSLIDNNMKLFQILSLLTAAIPSQVVYAYVARGEL